MEGESQRETSSLGKEARMAVGVLGVHLGGGSSKPPLPPASGGALACPGLAASLERELRLTAGTALNKYETQSLCFLTHPWI